MTATVHFMADPPQGARFGSLGVDGPYTHYAQKTDWLVGDRLSHVGSTFETSTYRCTTGGTVTLGTLFNPAGASPYNWGASVWTKITADSWANAATKARHECLNYIDCNARLLTQFQIAPGYLDYYGPFALIFVEPSTMLPRTGRQYIMPFSNDPESHIAPIFFGNMGMNGWSYHSRSRLNEVPVNSFPSGTSQFEINAVDAVGTVNVGGFDARSWRGCNITSVYAGSASVELLGVANTFTFPNASAVTASATPYATVENYDIFGNHINHPGTSSILGVNVMGSAPSTGRLLYSHSLTNLSDNTYVQDRKNAWGSQAALVVVTNIYRDGAAFSGNSNHSLQFGGTKNAGPGGMRVSPFFFWHNTLTGARTLTIHFLTDSPSEGEISDIDIWPEVFYPSSATTPKYSLATGENANWGVPACTKAYWPTDTDTWTYSGIYFPTAYKMTVTMTIQKAGMLFIRLNMAGRRLSHWNTYICPFFGIA
jgi:hypothetical protein